MTMLYQRSNEDSFIFSQNPEMSLLNVIKFYKNKLYKFL